MEQHEDSNVTSNGSNSETPNPSLISRMVGCRNESEVLINGQKCMALIDSGSDISTLSEGFYQSMDPKPKLLNMSDINLNITGASGSNIPYSGYFEVEVCMSNVEHEPVAVPILVIPATGYFGQVPLIVGTNILVDSGVVSRTILIFLPHGMMHLLHCHALKLN